MSTIKIRTKQSDGQTELRILITHPMHHGRQKDPRTGEIIPAHYIRQLRIERNGELITECQLSTAVSRDPYLSFRFREGATGDRIKVSWVDNLGESDTLETVLR